MESLRNIYLFILTFCLISCSGKEVKSWDIEKFNQKQVFSLVSPHNKTVNSANVYIEGDFSGKIKLQRSDGYPILEFSKDSIPKKVFYDFYGGEFKIILLPSDAKGEVSLTIEIPYNY